MLFSAENWDRAKQIKEIAKVSTALSYEMMSAPLRNSYLLFIVPLVGDELRTRLESMAANGTAGVDEETLLFYCRRANVFLAFWSEFDEINTRITDAGFQRQESEEGTFKPVYKYQEDNLRIGFKNKGFNALDSMLDYLETHIDVFPEYESAPSHQVYKSGFVKSTDEVERYYTIYQSRLIFLRLESHLRFVSEVMLPTVIGTKLHDSLMEHLDGSDDTFERLRVVSLGYVVCMAVRRLLSETGNITDRGLYFVQLTDKEGNVQAKPVPDERLSLQLKGLEEDIEAYKARLRRYIRRNFPDEYSGSETDVYLRDNDGKQSFWA